MYPSLKASSGGAKVSFDFDLGIDQIQ